MEEKNKGKFSYHSPLGLIREDIYESNNLETKALTTTEQHFTAGLITAGIRRTGSIDPLLSVLGSENQKLIWDVTEPAMMTAGLCL